MSDLHRAIQAEHESHTPRPRPSFDALLARKRRRTQRRTGLAIVSAAAAVAAVGAVLPAALRPPIAAGGLAGAAEATPSAAALADPTPTAAPSPSPGPQDGRSPRPVPGATVEGDPPATLTQDGQALARTGPVPVVGAYVDPTDDSVLVVSAGTGARPTYCNSWALVRVVAQTDQTVTLSAAAYRPAGPQPTDMQCSFVDLPPAQHRVELGVPLSGRRVNDTSRGRVLVVEPLVLTRLPTGYSQPSGPSSDLFQASAGVVDFTYPGPDKGTSIELYQGAADQVPGRDEPDGKSAVVVDRPVVRGHQAVLSRTPGLNDLTCLRWHESEIVVVMICSRGTPAPLDGPQLEQLASGLKHGSES